MINITDMRLYDDSVKGPVCILKIYHAKANGKKIVVITDSISCNVWVHYGESTLAKLNMLEMYTSHITLSDFVQGKLNDLNVVV